jgi:hypothetical protein
MAARFNSGDPLCIKQKSNLDFEALLNKISLKSPFSFIRFSDGELEIIRNRKLIIKSGEVIWSKGVNKHSYPAFDFKTFDPEVNFDLRSHLIESAKYSANSFIKGIPTTHNNALEDRDFMIELNGGSKFNLTFADLFLNQNFLKFRNRIIPKLLMYSNVFYVGNFRANPSSFSDSWIHVKVPDDVFLDYENKRKKINEILVNVPPNSLILLSASSLSNILAHQLVLSRNDLTILDVGTSLHDLVGLQSGIRDYHLLLSGNDYKSLLKKLRYKSRKGYRLKW